MYKDEEDVDGVPVGRLVVEARVRDLVGGELEAGDFLDEVGDVVELPGDLAALAGDLAAEAGGGFSERIRSTLLYSADLKGSAPAVVERSYELDLLPGRIVSILKPPSDLRV